MIFFIILGLLSFIMAVFLFGFYIRTLKNVNVIGEICGIDDNYSSYVPGVTVYHIVVQFNKNGVDKRLVALNRFIVIPFFERPKLSQLKKKHIGKQVNIYYNPDNYAQVLIREYMWKEFLLCAFLLCLGNFLIFAGIYQWY